MSGALFTLLAIIVGGFILLQGATLVLRRINTRSSRQRRAYSQPSQPENVKPIKGSPFSVDELFKDYPTLNKLNNQVIEKYQKISVNKEILTEYRNDLYGLLDVHQRLVAQWREIIGTPGYEMISVSAEILTKINVKLDAIFSDMYKESVEKLHIENKVLDQMK